MFTECYDHTLGKHETFTECWANTLGKHYILPECIVPTLGKIQPNFLFFPSFFFLYPHMVFSTPFQNMVFISIYLLYFTKVSFFMKIRNISCEFNCNN